MTFRDAFSSPSFTDIMYALDQGNRRMSKFLSSMTQLKRAAKQQKRTQHARMRASQGAAQSGHPNTPDGVGYVPEDEVEDPMARPTPEPNLMAALDTLLGSQKEVDTTTANTVELPTEAIQPLDSLHGAAHMTLTLKGLSKNGKRAIYSGAAVSLAFPLALFAGKQAPATITDLSAFAEKSVKQPKAKLTKEERAALPKPTLAEKIAKREAALAKDRAKLAAQSSM